MNAAKSPPAVRKGGIVFHDPVPAVLQDMRQRFDAHLEALGLQSHVLASPGTATDEGAAAGEHGVRFALHDIARYHLTPHADTLGLCQTLHLDTHTNAQDLEREILVAMLASPVCFSFPSYDELVSALRVRQNLVMDARKTALAFDTEHAERPEEYWSYTTECGFTLKPGRSLIAALEKTTQPQVSGKLYSFSCYRATEYVILLAIARELTLCNVPLLADLQAQWERRAIMSGEFHDVFLREYGSMDEPLPPRYYVPGDRVWFRNPDERSADVEGYEGSWVFYLGDGQFSNFWKRDQPYTLISKSVEIFHWRNATYRDEHGRLQVDDAVVDARVARTLQDPRELDRILALMQRMRDPSGLYQEGGCIDATRECVRHVRPGTSQLMLPRHAAFSLAS